MAIAGHGPCVTSVGCIVCRGASEEGAEPKVPARASVYPGGGRSGKIKPPKSGLSKAQKNKAKRHGAGVHGFKSKARHKRR